MKYNKLLVSRVSEALHERLASKSKEQGDRKLSDTVRELLEKALGEEVEQD